MKNKFDVPDFKALGKIAVKSMPVIGRVESLKFFKDRFIYQGWEDSSFQPWPKAKNPFAGKKALMSLRDSFNCKEETSKRVVIENTKSFASTHNDGALITVTEKMKKYFWWQYSIHAGSVQYHGNGNMYRGKENSNMNAKAKFCRAMALKPVGSKIKIPKRKFMGNSKKLMNNMEYTITNYIDRKGAKFGLKTTIK